MYFPMLICLVISVVLAILGYVVLPFISTTVASELVFAFGLLFGGILSPWLSQFFGHGSSEASDNGNTKTLYVGNLPYRANEDAVRAHFEEQGQVVSVRLMKDRRTGKRKGYGFVEMAASDAKGTVKALNDTEFQERTLKVRMAKEKSDD